MALWGFGAKCLSGWSGLDTRAILILTFFRNPYFAYSQVLPLGSLVSELFLFLLYDLSFPCGYFWSATTSFTLKLQTGHLTKIGDNFSLWSHIDPRSTGLSFVFYDLFKDSPTRPYFAHVVWWSTAQWTARTTRRKRPGRSLTVGFIAKVEIFFG